MKDIIGLVIAIHRLRRKQRQTLIERMAGVNKMAMEQTKRRAKQTKF